jgi:hypothetical protein
MANNNMGTLEEKLTSAPTDQKTKSETKTASAGLPYSIKIELKLDKLKEAYQRRGIKILGDDYYQLSSLDTSTNMIEIISGEIMSAGDIVWELVLDENVDCSLDEIVFSNETDADIIFEELPRALSPTKQKAVVKANLTSGMYLIYYFKFTVRANGETIKVAGDSVVDPHPPKKICNILYT